jgi:dolichyl-phosphate beta-glucosyltransferase
MPKYSIIIPAYNEAARLGSTLERVLSYVSRNGWDSEVIVVDDGSRDQTRDLVRSYLQGHPQLRLLQNHWNRGKGYSVRHGMLEAGGELLLFTDADLSAPIEESAKLFRAIESGADIAIGSRWLIPELQEHRQSPLRQLFGRLFNLALRILLGLRYKDTQCGFKAFNRRAANIIFPQQRIERWAFDPELLYLAGKAELKVEEVPVAWSHVGGTRIRPLRDGMRMFREVLEIRRNARAGKYLLKID